MDTATPAMDAALWITAGAILLLLVLSAFFSGSETALTAASRGKLRAQAHNLPRSSSFCQPLRALSRVAFCASRRKSPSISRNLPASHPQSRERRAAYPGGGGARAVARGAV